MAGRTSRPRIEALEGRALLASRLFALPLDNSSVITELDPHSGAEVHRFNAPVPADTNGENGLAFDGRVIYYMPHDGTDRLWELDPDSGSVIRTAPVGDGSGHVDGIGVVGGKVYLQDHLNNQLVVVDPLSETVVGRLGVAADLIGGLTGADGPDELFATEGLTTAVRIDPATGTVLGRFALPGPVYGAAFVGGDLYFGSSQSVVGSPNGHVYVTDRTGRLLATLSTPYPVSALGGDAVEAEAGTEQVVNGGFESGDLSGWHSFVQSAGFGQSFQVYSTADPFGRPLPAPPQGFSAATNDLQGPGTEVLYQDITLPAGKSAHLSMLVGYNNQASAFATPDSLDPQTYPNQQIRIDIVDPNANPLSTAAGDVLLTVFQTKVGGPNTIAPSEITADLSAFAGRTVRLRVAVAENQNFLDAVVDGVSIRTSGEIPPPPVPGPYYVADPDEYGGGTGEVIRIDPTTGAQTVVSSGDKFIDPFGVTVAPDGSLIVADHGTFGGTGTLFRVDPVTGAQTVIATGGLLVDPSGVVIAPDGSLLVADFASGGIARVIRVDPATGGQTLLADVGLLQGPFGLATAPDGSIYAADFGGYAGGFGQIIRIDPVTGSLTLIAIAGQLSNPSGLVVAPDGTLIVSNSNAMSGQSTIVRVDPQTGNQTLISQGGLFQQPIGVALTLDGRLLVADAEALGGLGALIAVDLATGAQSVVASGGHFQNPLGVAVAPATTPPPVATEQVVNGGFESGDLSGWHSVVQPGSFGQSFQTYHSADPNGRPLPAPPQGNSAATNDLQGPGTEVLYQDITLPAGQPANLSMLVGYNNLANGFFTPDSLDFQIFPNQQIRIDIVNPNADLLSTAAGDVLLTVFRTKVGDPNTRAPFEIKANLSDFAGRTVRLRVSIVENQSYLDAVVDAVSIKTGGGPPISAPTAYYVADLEDFGGGTGKVIRIDATTGAQTVVSSGGQFIDPYGVTEAPDGSLIVADQGLLGGTGTLFRVDPVTGAQTVITTNGYLVDPFQVVIDPHGSLLVADFGMGGFGRIIRVDPASGEQTLVSDAGMLLWPFGIATAPDGSIYVASSGFVGETGQVFRVDPVTGAQTLIATGGDLTDPADVVVAPDGSLIVSDPTALGGQGAIFRIDPATGAQTLISQGGLFRRPIGLAITPAGRLIVADPGALDGVGALIGVDLVTGEQSVVASGGLFLHNPQDVAVGTATTPPHVDTPPTASAGGPYTVEEGTTVTLDASGTTDPDQDPASLTYLWDLNGNGVFGETGPAASNGDEVGVHPVFSAAGLPGGATLTVSLEVIDASGQKSLATSTITIDNRPPVVTLGPDATVDAASTFIAHGSFSDPGAGEDYRASVDYGDGAGLQVLPLNPDRTFDLSRVYARAGTYSVVVYVADGNGGLGRSSLVVTVNAITPVYEGLTGASITYGQGVVTLGGHITGGAWTPQGGVSITLAGITQTATIDPATGAFSTVFSTAMLGVQGSPYAVTYSYAGDGTYGPSTDSSQSLAVAPRALTVTTQDVSKVYGEPDPTYSAAYDGFAPGEGPEVLGGALAFAMNVPAGNAPVGTYAITPSGLASPNYALAYVPGTLTVIRATTSFSALGSPTIVIGTASATFTGVLGSNSVLPVGQEVTVTIVGANGPLASVTGTVGSDGRFSATIATASLPAGSFTVRYIYAGDQNFTSTDGSGNLAVTYNVAALYDTTKAHRAGRAVPIQIAVRDVSGNDLSSSSLVVSAVQIIDAQGTTYPPGANVDANPGGVFRKTVSGYKYKLDTSGLAPGKYTLLVTIGDDPVKHALTFVVR